MNEYLIYTSNGCVEVYIYDEVRVSHRGQPEQIVFADNKTEAAQKATGVEVLHEMEGY